MLGTSSLRRAALAKMKRPDLKVVPLRGNVQTRLHKLLDGEIHATLLAKAGLNRLRLYDVAGTVLPVGQFLPAIAQGAIGIECNESDHTMRELLAKLSHPPTEQAVACERAFLKVLDGSCRTPIAGHATVEKGQMHFSGLIALPDGTAHHKVELSGDAGNAEALGKEAGQQLLGKAGRNFLG